MSAASRRLRVRLIKPMAIAVLLAAVACTAPLAMAQSAEQRPRTPLIFVPGLMGSQLCRDNPADPGKPRIVWGSLSALREFPSIRLSREPGMDDGIRPCGLLREVVLLGSLKQTYYGPAIRHLETIGYREGRDLFVFDYDWRRSALDNAQALDAFVRARTGDARVDILAHSMGGLVARVYTVEYGKGRVARLFSAGAPFLGAAKVFQTVETGWGPLNAAMGGLAGFRSTMLSFPSIFELMARYDGCCGAGAPFQPSRAEAWTALGWEGVNPSVMPDLSDTFSRIHQLSHILAQPLPVGVEDVLLIGVDQRTTQAVSFERIGGAIGMRVQTTWAGDGTVLRDSAILPRTAMHPTSFAIHQRILEDPQILDFLKVALSQTIAAALESVPVRPRGAVAGVSGEVTELVGIVVETGEPAYATGDKGVVRVHVRLGAVTKLSPETISLSHTIPDGRAANVRLVADPSASDPNNPFEQSFVGTFDTGARPGFGELRAAVTLADGPPRIVTEPVLIVAR